MGKKRFAIVAVVCGVLALAGYVLPLKPTVTVIDIDINIVVLFRSVLPFFLIGLALDAVSIWGRRVFPGKIGTTIAETAERYVPAFIYMVPVEVTYIILFVALTIHSALVWNSGLFPYFFLPGILVLPFIFNGRSLVVSIRNTGLLFVDLGRRLWRKTRGTTPVPWGYLFTSWLEVVWLYAGIEGVAGLIGYEVVTKGVNSATAWIEVIGVVVLAGVSFILVVLKWKYPDPKKT